MATKNIPLTVVRPNVTELTAITFSAAAAANNDLFRIPRRYPFVDIANYDALAAADYFRHGSKAVSSVLGGSAVTDTEGVLGFQLPRTEKLFLLVELTGVASTGSPAIDLTLAGADGLGIDDLKITIPADETLDAATKKKYFEFSLFDLGLYIASANEAGAVIKVTSATGYALVKFALIARTA